MTITTAPLAVGTRVRVIHGLFLNSELLADRPEGVIIDNSGKSLDGVMHPYKVDLGPDSPLQRTNGGPIWVTAVEVWPSGSIMASLPHQTSRDYAADSVSQRSLDARCNDVLIDAAAGKEVDVLELRKAATAALDLARTRGKDRPASADFARKARHLIYWADALIEQHVNELPIYEPGARSPRIAELEQEIAQLKQAASDERRRLCEEIDGHKAELHDLRIQYRNASGALEEQRANVEGLRRQAFALQDELDRERAVINSKGEVIDKHQTYIDDLEADLAKVRGHNERITRSCERRNERIALLRGKLRESDKAVAEFANVVLYAFEHMDEPTRARVLGFWDGIEG